MSSSVWGWVATAGACGVLAAAPTGGEVLCNGITLPKAWPPTSEATTAPASTREPMRVPYLEAENIPDPIWIDVGRQLFVDDFLIAETDLARVFPKPVKYEGNPVLRPETALEQNRPQNACTVPKGGGVWWDAAEGVYKLWYEAGWIHTICHATSKDGIHWERPSLDVVPGTNQVLPPDLVPDSWSVVPDPDAVDPEQRYKMFLRGPGGEMTGWALTSADGIHWTNRTRTGACMDRSSMFYNPFRRKWVFSLRGYWGAWGKGGVRSRHYREADDFLEGASWTWNSGASTKDCVLWAAPDRLDPEDPGTKFPVQLYSLDAVPYESIMLGFWEIHHGPENDVCMKKGLPKITDLVFAYSRDGFHWSRPDRAAAIASARWGSDKWDTGYVQAAANLCVIEGERLRFYYGAFRGDPSRTSGDWMRNGMYDNGAMGFATLRRDGFVGLKTEAKGSVTTRPVLFSGSHLFVNVEAPQGTLRAEVLDADGTVLPGFAADECVPVRGDTVKASLAWRGRANLAELCGRRVRFRFLLEKGTFYSFWVSPRKTGESGGYLAGGGPAYRALVDR